MKIKSETWNDALDKIGELTRELEIERAKSRKLAQQIFKGNRAMRASKWALENTHNQEDEAWKGTRRRALRNIAEAMPDES